MRSGMTQARRHPVVTFLAVLIFSPFLLAAAALYIVVFVIASAFSTLRKVRQ